MACQKNAASQEGALWKKLQSWRSKGTRPNLLDRNINSKFCFEYGFTHRLKELEPHSTAAYQIIVQSRTESSWVDLLGDMTICPPSEEVGPQVTSFEGELSDQAALSGVLNTLYELHLTLLLGVRRSLT